jgi:hypothetical protein
MDSNNVYVQNKKTRETHLHFKLLFIILNCVLSAPFSKFKTTLCIATTVISSAILAGRWGVVPKRVLV